MSCSNFIILYGKCGLYGRHFGEKDFYKDPTKVKDCMKWTGGLSTLKNNTRMYFYFQLLYFYIVNKNKKTLSFKEAKRAIGYLTRSGTARALIYLQMLRLLDYRKSFSVRRTWVNRYLIPKTVMKDMEKRLDFLNHVHESKEVG